MGFKDIVSKRTEDKSVIKCRCWCTDCDWEGDRQITTNVRTGTSPNVFIGAILDKRCKECKGKVKIKYVISIKKKT